MIDVLVSGTLANVVFYRSPGTSIVIPYNDVEIPATQIDFAVATPTKSPTVMAARLICYLTKSKLPLDIDNPAFVAAGIIEARCIRE